MWQTMFISHVIYLLKRRWSEMLAVSLWSAEQNPDCPLHFSLVLCFVASFSSVTVSIKDVLLDFDSR